MRPTAKLFSALAVAAALIVPFGISDATDAAAAPAITWKSGASNYGVADGSIGAWRGRGVDVAGTWSDDASNSVNFWQFQKGGAYANWDKSVDVAVGGIFAGETWAKAAQGAYDARWTQSLTRLRDLRGGKEGVTYIRFAHEMNGNWYPWSVNSSNYKDFMTAWKRYRALQQSVFPQSKLIFSVNRESVGANMDWTKFFPGKQYVDAMSVDYYNQYPYVATASDWTKSLNETDQWGAPKGLAKHLAFAKSQGLYLAISEWSGNAGFGDSPAFVDGLLGYVKANAGWHAGQIWYEILFNSQDYGGSYSIYGGANQMPNSTAAYKKFFAAP